MVLAKGFHHIVITVSNAQRSKEFYMKVLRDLGWEVFHEEKDNAGLSDGKVSLWLSEPRDYKIEDNKFDRNRTGLDHFAFNIETMAELKKVEAILKKNKIRMSKEGITDDGFGGTGIFLTDPDGMKVEFHLKK
ncbi:MAG: VOC family protein [Candidatus Aenigmarchaeota archaeon]|nr:VOC family protein [Candidatus Aenigmarchaeota archaeon]